MKPVLKYAGGKTWLLPRLRELFDSRRRLVEPFVGSMAVALGLEPEHALLADSNPHLVGFHLRLRDPRPFAITMLNNERFYYSQRDVFNALAALSGPFTVEGSEIFYYLNRTGFNGLCRFNKSGVFNVPFGKYATITYRTDFSEYAPLLSRWKIYHQPWQQTMRQAQAGDFVFADPPYDNTFDTYSGEAFSWEQQVQLADALAAHVGPVVATNSTTPRILTLYRERGFSVGEVEVRRSISADGDRDAAKEMLAMKNIDQEVSAGLTVLAR